MYKYSNAEHTAVTNLNTGATGIHPGVWMWKQYQEWVNADGVTEPFDNRGGEEIRLEQLEEDLAAIDSEVMESQKQPFVYNGNNYYPDTEFIQGMYSALPLFPVDHTEVWKTTDKQANGIDNVYVTLDKAGIEGLALAYLNSKKQIWADGEQRKQVLKDVFNQG